MSSFKYGLTICLTGSTRLHRRFSRNRHDCNWSTSLWLCCVSGAEARHVRHRGGYVALSSSISDEKLKG